MDDALRPMDSSRITPQIPGDHLTRSNNSAVTHVHGLMTAMRGDCVAAQRDQNGGATVSTTGSDADRTKTL